MSIDYQRVQWTSHKKWYDLTVTLFFVILVMSFMVTSLISFAGDTQFSAMILMIRAFGLCAIVSLHLILAIGPLSRIDSRFLPLLYNRRHLGVMTFVVTLFHFALVLLFYHGFGNMNPLVSLLIGNTQYHSLSAFPFELFGLSAFAIMFALAATSHDFWQKYFGKVFWKSLHMFIYIAYFFVMAHILLGVYQTEQSGIYSAFILLGFSSLSVLHIWAGWKSSNGDYFKVFKGAWHRVASVEDFKEGRAKVFKLSKGEDIAVFMKDGKFSAVTNVCAHQGGPLGEGKIIDGCITCPWHGWQYKPEDGQSPPPFEEKIETYETKVIDGVVFVNINPKDPGTYVRPSGGTE